MTSRALPLIAAVALFAGAVALAGHHEDPLAAAIAGDHRSDANRARDAWRHPQETLAFFGFAPDLTVVEFWPGGGW